MSFSLAVAIASFTVAAVVIVTVGSRLARLGVSRLAAVIPLHSHYDHAMDAPLVAARPGRVLLVHWDSLLAPLEGPLRGEMRLASLIAGGGERQLRDWLARRRATSSSYTVQTLPRFDEVVLWR